MYAVIPDSVQFQHGTVSCHILNTKNNVTLSLTVDTLQKETTRIRINEIDPIRARYEVTASLVEEPQKKR